MLLCLGEEKYPDVEFTPLSSENSRLTRQRLTTNRLINRFHRKKSAYVRNESDVERLVTIASQVICCNNLFVLNILALYSNHLIYCFQ